MGENEIDQLKSFLHKIDKTLESSIGEVQRLVRDVESGKKNFDSIRKNISELNTKIASEIASQETQNTRIKNVEVNVDKIEGRLDRLFWGVIVGMGSLLLAVIGLILTKVFGA